MTHPALVEFVRARLDEDERVAHDALLGYPASMHASAGQPALPLPTPTTPGAEWRAEYQNVRRTDGFRIVAEATQASAQVADHIARHDPARVLVEVAAKRRIVEIHDGGHSCVDLTGMDDYVWPRSTPPSYCATLCLLGALYVDHPDYRQEWTP